MASDDDLPQPETPAEEDRDGDLPEPETPAEEDRDGDLPEPCLTATDSSMSRGLTQRLIILPPLALFQLQSSCANRSTRDRRRVQGVIIVGRE